MTENVTQNTFGDRLAALTEAIAARPDAVAEDHLTYAKFLLSGERPLETVASTINLTDDDLNAMRATADSLQAIVGEVETEKVVSSTPGYLVGKKVKESRDDEYPVGVRAKDEDGDLWVKDSDGWVNHAHHGWTRDRRVINEPWEYNARFIA